VLWTCIFSSSLLLLVPAHVALAQVVINEIADKGTGNACSGEDWIELYNRGDTEVSLAGYILHDDQGPEDSDAFVFHNTASGLAEILSMDQITVMIKIIHTPLGDVLGNAS